MKLIYLIHAHKNLNQLNNLIELLTDENIEIYVNLDLKSDIKLEEIHPKAKTIKERIPIIWGDFSQVEATLNSMKEIAEKENQYSHIFFISAQDFPIKSNKIIRKKIEIGKDYLDFTAIIGNEYWKVHKNRYELYHYFQRDIWIIKFFIKCINKIIKISKNYRKMPMKHVPFGGSQWWILSQKTINYLINFIKQNKKYIKFFKLTSCADEMFFQTILCNSAYKNQIVNNHFRYIDWSEKGSSPKLLDISDYDKIMSSDCLFCRKVESPRSDKLTEKLLENIRQNEQQ